MNVMVTFISLQLCSLLILIAGDIDVQVNETELVEEEQEDGPPELWLDEVDCPTIDARLLEHRRKFVPWGTPYRAFLTIPKETVLAPSSIPSAGQGIFSRTFIKRFTWLDDYEGEIIESADDISDYAWKIMKSGYVMHYIDGFDITMSNWMRWINCARTQEEENVGVLECQGRVFYMTWKDVYPGEELLVYYGNSYAETLGITPWE